MKIIDGDHRYAGDMVRHRRRSSRGQSQQEARPQAEQQRSKLQQQASRSAMMMNLPPIGQVNVLHGYPNRMSVPTISCPYMSSYLAANAADWLAQPPTIPHYTPGTVRRTQRHQMHPNSTTQNSFASGQNTHSRCWPNVSYEFLL
jgi:hypothetical protein